MKRLPFLRIALLALAATLVSTTLHPQARGPTAKDVLQNGQPIGPVDEAGRAERLAELKQWLSNLPGRYRFDGMARDSFSFTRLEGIVDCVSIGQGPGVHCVFNGGGPPGNNGLSMILFGLSADNLQIQVLNVGATSQGWYGRLAGDTLVLDRYWNVGCLSKIINWNVPFCFPEVTITARSESKFVTIEETSAGAGVKLELKREPQSKKDKDSKSP